MKRRLIPLLLTAVLVLSLLPVTALGALTDYPVQVSNFNTGGVRNGPTKENSITVGKACIVRSVTTYHWNNGRGASPGSIIIEEDDVVIGTWQATGRSGSGADNVYWDIFPNVTFHPGHSYSVYPSSRETWSWNDQTGGLGMIEIRGQAAETAKPTVDGYTCSAWAQAEVAKAKTYGLIPASLSGGDLTKPISRADFAAVSLRAYQTMAKTTASGGGSNPFTDTSDREVLAAYSLGIVNGTSATTFSPGSNLTREQASTMLTRAYKRIVLPGWTLAQDGSYRLDYTRPSPFADQSKISSYALDSVAFMASKDILNGVGNNTFAPKNSVTREQALAIAVRMVENLDTTPQAVDPVVIATDDGEGVSGPASAPVVCGDMTITTKSSSGTVGVIENSADLPAGAASKGYDIVLTDDVTGPVTLSLPMPAPEANASYTIYLGVPAEDQLGNGSGVIWTGLDTTYADGKVTAQFTPFDAQDLLEGILSTGNGVELKAKKTSPMLKLLEKLRQANIRGRAVRAVVGKEYRGVSSGGHFRLHVPWEFTDQGYKGVLPKGGLTLQDVERMLEDLEYIHTTYETTKGYTINYPGRFSASKGVTSYPMDVFGFDETNGLFGQTGMYINATGNMDIGVFNLQDGGYRRSGYTDAARVVYGTLSHEFLHCIQRGYLSPARASRWFDEATACYMEMVFQREKGFKQANGKGTLDGNSYRENYSLQLESMVPSDTFATSSEAGYGRLPFIEYCDSLTSTEFIKEIYADGGHTLQSGLHSQIEKFTKKSMKELCEGFYNTFLTTDKLTAMGNEPWTIYNGSLGETFTLKGKDTMAHSFYPIAPYGVNFLRLQLGAIDKSCTSFNIRPRDSSMALTLLILDEDGSYKNIRKYSARDGAELTGIPILPRRYLLILINPANKSYDYGSMANVQITFNQAKGPFASTKAAIAARPTSFTGTVYSIKAGAYCTSNDVKLTLNINPENHQASLSLTSDAYTYSGKDLSYDPSTGLVTDAEGRCTAQFAHSIYTDEIKEGETFNPFEDDTLPLTVTFRKANGELEAAFLGSGGGITVEETSTGPF